MTVQASHRSRIAALLVACVVLLLHGPAEGAGVAGDIGSGNSLALESRAETFQYVDTNAVSVFSPSLSLALRDPLRDWNASGSYLVDVVSAASVDIVSTATPRWQELRHVGSLAGSVGLGGATVGLAGAVSREPDYLSLNGGGSVALELANKTVTPTLGYTYGYDQAGLRGTSFDVFSLNLARHSVNGALEMVVNRETLIVLVADGIFERGRQEKPYRFLPLFTADEARVLTPGVSAQYVNSVRLPGKVPEHLPQSRNRTAFTFRLAQRIDVSTLLLAQRFYADDWGLKSSTTDVGMVFDASSRIDIRPSLRAHVQSAVSFWKMAYVGTFGGDPNLPGVTTDLPKWRTGDRELGALESFTLGLGTVWKVGPRARPESWNLLFEVNGMTTHFQEALYISNRQALFGGMQLEALFE